MKKASTLRLAKKRGKLSPAKTLIPVTLGSNHASIFNLAKLLSESEPVLFVGIVPVGEEQNLSKGAQSARELRKVINSNVDRINLRAKPRVRVTHTPWDDILKVIVRDSSIELLVLELSQIAELGVSADELLSHPPCDIAVVGGEIPEKLNSVLVPMRGGPHAERALSTALHLAKPNEAKVTSLHLKTEKLNKDEENSFSGLEKVVTKVPNVDHQTIISTDNLDTILIESSRADLVVLGTAASPNGEKSSFGSITDGVFKNANCPVIALKTKRDIPKKIEPRTFGSRAISVLVDQWFAENTFHSEEFSNLAALASLKEERGQSISLALPTLNEEETIGDIIKIAKKYFMQDYPIIDEIVLIDSNSTDSTREIAADLGIPVYIHQEILPQYGARRGKGEALWKSLYVTKGDIVIWADTDVSNFHPRFLYGLIGPLLTRKSIQFVKGFYRRPIKTGAGLQSGRGGRVTELTARPLLNLFYPELSGIIQPLSGEYGGRREVLEKLIFTSGYGVETSLLIDVYEKYKLSSIAQIDMVERVHNNQALHELSKMSFAILQTFFSRLEKKFEHPILEDANRTMKLMKYEPGMFYLEVNEIAELERPAMLELEEYRRFRGIDDKKVANDSAKHSKVVPYSPRAN